MLMKPQHGNALIGGVAAMTLLIAMVIGGFLITSLEVVDEHSVGVLVEDGEITGTVQPGINFVTPGISDVVRIPRTLQERRREGINAASSDNYNVKGSVVEYTYLIPNAGAMALYKDYPDWDSIISSEVNSVTKDVLGEYRMIEIPRNRSEIGQEIRARLQSGIGDKIGVDFHSASLAAYGWGQSARKHIQSIKDAEARKDTEREKLQETELRNERLEKEQTAELERKRRQNEAENARKLKRAEAAAEAEVIKAEAEAEAMAKIAQQLSEHPELIERQRIKAWDGALPVITGPGETKVDFGDLK